MRHGDNNNPSPVCMLFETSAETAGSFTGALSGMRGAWDTAKWTSLPEHFRNQGYFVLGTGKVMLHVQIAQNSTGQKVFGR
eukprot:SAG11_NODE_7881_length_1085_cov_1.356998_1_plen_81_part_00